MGYNCYDLRYGCYKVRLYNRFYVIGLLGEGSILILFESKGGGGEGGGRGGFL